MSTDSVLQHMIKQDSKDFPSSLVSHHKVENPYRIDVKADEVVYIDRIELIETGTGAWLEFHSATESRIVQDSIFAQVTRHKGSIHFSHKQVDKFSVSYVKLKLIP
jgi:hypothetical protein